MPAELRIKDLPRDTVLMEDDAFPVDHATRGTRKLSPRDLGTQLLIAAGDSVYLRAEVADALIGAQNETVETASQVAAAASALATQADVQAQQAADQSTAAMDLAQAAAGAASGFPVASYLGEISSLGQAPGAASANSGKWYTVTVEGILSDSAVFGLSVRPGDRLLSNGTAWQRWVQPPTYITPGSISWGMLEKRLRDLGIETEDETYAVTWEDRNTRRALAIRMDGMVVGRFLLQAGAVTAEAIQPEAVGWSALSPDITGVIPETIPNNLEFKFEISDQQGRVAFGIREDGTTFLRFLPGEASISGQAISPGSFPVSRFDPAAARAILSSPGDIVTSDWDGFTRGVRIDASAVTDSGTGALPVPFPAFATPVLYGTNGTGTTLEFCRGPGFSIRGTNYRGTWAGAGVPNSVASEGDWWAVTASGSLGGVNYAIGDRIVCLGSTRMSATVTAVWAKGRPGEFWFRGEFSPGSGLPSSPADGEVWIASASGTASGITLAAGDWLFRTGGAWLPVPREDAKTVADGASWSYRTRNAEDVWVRRADKSATSVATSAFGYRTNAKRRTADGIIFRGDSMVATGGLNTALAALLAPRVISSQSWSAANSAQVIAAALRDIAGADAFSGWLHLWMMGTNDYGDDDATKRGALRAARLSGSADGRVVFLTVCGQFALSWNGTRLVADVHEGMKAGSHHLASLESWYSAAFPGRHIRTLKALLDRAPSIPSLHWPGMTEAAAAAAYGAAPSSFFFDYASKPFTAAQLTFVGYRSAAGLPTGGTDGEYYLRTGGGTVGQPIIRWAGSWTEYPIDITHLTPAGNQALADGIADFLSENLL